MFDAAFGTYQAAFKEDSSGPSGRRRSRTNYDAKASLDRWWWPEHPLYVHGGMLGMGLWLWLLFNRNHPALNSVLVTTGPILWAFLLTLWDNSRLKLPWRKVVLSPFDKDPSWSIVLHFGAGIALGVLPATYFVYLVLSKPFITDTA
jgi:hypothetical protein